MPIRQLVQHNMKANELRKKYIEYFVSKGHVQIPSASLIPENDPSVLFTTAGMHPLVPFLMGEEHPAGRRLVGYQKCVRTGDIDEVGDDTHLTFFEMLGNWSLGSYFKSESIEMSFEFLTSKKWLNLLTKRLAVSVFAGDDNAPFDQESYDKWLELGIPESRIKGLDKNENWWPAGGKHTGPQGPDTEIFYWTGEGEAPPDFDPEDDRWVEIWNNVFMEYYQDGSGVLSTLSQKNVDTGMGLERTAAVLQGKKSVYETELFVPIIMAIASASDVAYEYDASSPIEMRIIADHIRTSVMIISDGVLPSNKDQGYILRRLIRRSVRHMLKLTSNQNLRPVAEAVIETLKDAYPDLETSKDRILEVVKNEEDKFYKTVEKGERQLRKLFDKKGQIDGHDAFDLYQTNGFPLELTTEIAEEHGQKIDKTVFEAEFQKHQELSRAGAGQKFAGGLVDDSEDATKLHTATHLLHSALRQVLGYHVEQRGSNITADRLRFDFAHDTKLTPEQLADVEDLVNEQIDKALPVHQEVMTVEEAKDAGAIGLFEDKYKSLGDKVKVYCVGDFSKEICGGPHAGNTAELGKFKIKKEEASSAGVRRIKAVLGD